MSTFQHKYTGWKLARVAHRWLQTCIYSSKLTCTISLECSLGWSSFLASRTYPQEAGASKREVAFMYMLKQSCRNFKNCKKTSNHLPWEAYIPSVGSVCSSIVFKESYNGFKMISQVKMTSKIHQTEDTSQVLASHRSKASQGLSCTLKDQFLWYQMIGKRQEDSHW